MRVLLVLGLLLSGCAALPHGELARCHGPRRPANPHGSILAPAAAASPSPPSAAVPAAAAPRCGGRP